MTRHEMINIIGSRFLTSNIENDEFSYAQVFEEEGLPFKGIKIKGRTKTFADLRFTNGRVTVIVETKQDFNRCLSEAENQLSAYLQYEKELTGNKIVAILANTINDEIKVWLGDISDENLLRKEYKLRSFNEYADFYSTKVNNKEQIMRNTFKLNELLNKHGIQERLRSQFVGTCLLTLKNSKGELTASTTTTNMILGEMKRILGTLLDDSDNKVEKIRLLDKNVLDSQDIRNLPDEVFREILRDIHINILPFINDKTTLGQDLLNLFFVTFNKYVGKADKNQAFTPDHITDFMSKVVEVNRHSRVLDPCCGSGSFLVRAMTQAMDDCASEAEKISVKSNQIYGIEFDENVFGLATTNMLIHSDGNSNIINKSCFDMTKDIQHWGINTILMNPPYNGTRKTMPLSFVKTWGKKTKQDPSKGLFFVKWAADTIKTGKLAVLLPMACAIGKTGIIKQIKKELLQENTLDAVFSLPPEIFYPGASAQACCMVFTLGKRHDSTHPTFFGYYKEDGFTKKKNLGRVERVDARGEGIWADIEKQWIDLYRDKKVVDGLSAVQCVTSNDEWLAEAYMKTDYTKLIKNNFIKERNNYLAYLISLGQFNEFNKIINSATHEKLLIDLKNWKEFKLTNYFKILPGIYHYPDEYEDGYIPYLSAANTNNGVGQYINLEPDFKGNCIVTGKIGCTAFYQSNDFCATSDVNIFIPKFLLTPFLGLFITTVINFNENYRWAYGRQCRVGNSKKMCIKLPATADGKPDWEWMENYIKGLPIQ